MRQFILVVAVLGSLVSLLATAAAEPLRVRTIIAASASSTPDEKVEKSDDAEDAKKDGPAEKVKEDAEEKITLERLFPEKSFFGPAARSMAFSADGKYAAYLYRPYLERRHGSDLWIYNVGTGESQRVTAVSVMSKFQEATRKVKEDRLEKAKQRKGKPDDAKEKDDNQTDAAADVVTGEWHGILTGPAAFNIPPEGVAFILSLELDDTNAVGGTFRSVMADATVTEGRWDAEREVVSCTLVDPESGLTGALTAKITADDSLEGAIVTENPSATFEITAERLVTTDTKENNDLADDEAGTSLESGAADGNDDGNKDTEEENGTDDNGADQNELIDTVGEKDADDEKAPRYGGVSSFQWAPEKNALMFISGGDVYEYAVEGSGEITRLTRSKERESGVQYLPDGSGYTLRRGNGVLKVTFGSHLVEQIDPAFPAGEEMTSYQLSPDGTRVAFTTTKGESFWGKGRKVSIVNYRQRFAQVREVTRHMSDDPRPAVEQSVYLYQINDSMAEDGQLDKVYHYSSNGPRDTFRGPEWALDSSRIVFTRYSQADNLVRILEATYPDAADEADAADDTGEEADEADEADEDQGTTDGAANANGADEKSVIKAAEAKVVYQFSHNGGPNTPGMMRPYYLADSRRIALITELSGFRHLHVLDPLYEQLEQITRGRYEVYPLRISKDHRYLFVTATKTHPAQLGIYRIELETGEMTRLDQLDGSYRSVAVSNDGRQVLANFVDYGRLRELVAIDTTKENSQKTLTDSHSEEAHKLTKPIPEMFTYQNRHGQDIYGHMFKPADWTPEDQRPLLIYVYGGPLGTSKMVNRGSYSSDAYFFAYYMAQEHGYVTCTIDPRGASGYGGLFEKSNFEQVGKPQVEDLVDGAKWFIENQGVDAKRVGIHGWSFGGFQTQMCLYTEPEVFACGIAGAGPTEWENYNSWYSTGTIGSSREGKTDLAKFSLLPLAKNLKAKLLLVHGMEDSNVLYQDTVRVYRELLKAGKETNVELFLDPTGGHGLGGDVKRIGRMRKYEDFLLRTLGEGEAASAKCDNDNCESDCEDCTAGEAEEKGPDADAEDDGAAAAEVDAEETKLDTDDNGRQRRLDRKQRRKDG